MTKLFKPIYLKLKIKKGSSYNRLLSSTSVLLTHDDQNKNSKIEFTEAIYPNDLRKQVLKRTFDKNKIFKSTDLNEEDSLNKDLVNLSDEKKELLADLKTTELAWRGAEKMLDDKIPRKDEYKSLSTLKKKYDSFFDGDSDSDSNLDSNSTSSNDTKSKDAQAVLNIEEYITTELEVNIKERKSLKKSVDPEKHLDKGKRKLEEDSDNDSSSKKSRQSPSDFIDDLEKDYNPFDDLGED